MPKSPVLRLFIINWALGVALGCAFAGAFLAFDIGGMYSLIKRSELFVPALALLFGGFSITCGGVVCASAIMRVTHETDDDHCQPGLGADLVPVPVAVRRR